MDLSGSHTYEAPVEAVIAMLGDHEAAIAMFQSMNHRDVEILEREAREGFLRIRSSQVVDVNLPGFAKKVMKPTNTVIETDEWHRQEDGSWRGTLDVEVKGAPMHISGTMSLIPSDGKCVHEANITVDVNVPIIGGRIADWAGKNEARQNLDDQFAFNTQWLAHHREP
jgi:hypothetical protein